MSKVWASYQTLSDSLCDISRTLFAVNRVVATLAAGGDDVILDIVLPGWDVLQDAVERFRSFPVLFVALHCPVEDLERR